MNNLPIVNMLHAQAQLSEHIQNILLTKRPPSLLLDFVTEVAAISIVHHNTQLTFFGLEGFDELDDVRVLEVLDDFSLLESFLALMLAHARDVDDLHDAHESVRNPLN